MDVAVLGMGRIGGALGRAFAGAGHAVTFGSRTPGDGSGTGAMRAGSDLPGSDIPVSDIPAAVGAAEVVVLAVPGAAAAPLVRDLGSRLAGKLVIDATNNRGTASANASADVAEAAPEARYARAFNTLGFENLEEPRIGGELGDMVFSCDQADRRDVEALISAVGLRPVFVGEGRDAHEIVDGMMRLWLALTLGQGWGRHLGFRVLSDDGPAR